MSRPDPAAANGAAGIPAAELTVLGEPSVLGEVLSDVDEFLRCGDVAERLAAFYAHRGHPHPRSAANNLIDGVGFTALLLRGGHDQAGSR